MSKLRLQFVQLCRGRLPLGDILQRAADPGNPSVRSGNDLAVGEHDAVLSAESRYPKFGGSRITPGQQLCKPSVIGLAVFLMDERDKAVRARHSRFIGKSADTVHPLRPYLPTGREIELPAAKPGDLLRAIEALDGLAMRRSSLRHPLFQGLVRQPQAVGHVMPATMRHLEWGRDLGQKFAGVDEKAAGVGSRRRLLNDQPKHGVMQRQKVEQAVSFGERRPPQLERSNELGF